MVGAEVSAAAVPVENGGQVGEVAVQVDALGVGPAVGPAVQQVTLEGGETESWKRSRHGNGGSLTYISGSNDCEQGKSRT